jgi:hypothetical protein
MSNHLNYGSWHCESCDDIFDAETQDEEIYSCPACGLECNPLCNDSMTWTTFVDATTSYLYVWDGTKCWQVDPPAVDVGGPTCSCSTKTLLQTGCQCGGQ